MEPEKSLKDMSIKDDLYLSPFEKYTLYGIFPWSFLLSLILVILSTSEIIFYISINTNYSYQQLLLWNKVFLNRDADGSDTMMIPEFNIYHYPKLKTYIQQSVDVKHYIEILRYQQQYTRQLQVPLPGRWKKEAHQALHKLHGHK